MAVRIWSVVGLVMLWGCVDRELKPLNPCLVSAVSDALFINNIDKVDLLFMVDNSKSMADEQAALAEQFPRLIKALTTGDRDLDGKPDFRPAKDLHLGVVSSNMGIAGAVSEDTACRGVGDDGVLLHRATAASLPSCMGDAYPSFLSYRAGGGDPNTTAADFACIAALGTRGCGFEQQLEASLKALWPSMDAAGAPHAPPPHGPFLGAPGTLDGASSLGHGDRENAGFLRSGVGTESSLLAIIVVTDEEDCSSSNTHHFTDAAALSDGDPVRQQENYQHLNLRCFNNKQNLFPVERYIEGFKALRPDPDLVVFAAIVGVPDELVGPAALAKLNFSDAAQREAFYGGILNDPRMAEVVDPASFDVKGKGPNLKPSCSTAASVAYPPRRIVEVARGMGENALIQSICQSDFTPALDAIVSVIAHKLGALCLPRPLVRNSEGQVSCNMLWELPANTADAPAGAPTQCGAPGWEFLLPAGERDTPKGPAAVCKVAQLAVHGANGAKSHVATDDDGRTFTEGWYYDDYSAALQMSCRGSPRQGIGFSENGVPPTGVTVKLACLNEIQTYDGKRLDVASNLDQPTIGDRCDDVQRNGQSLSREDACAVSLANGQVDRSMFCHPELNVCVLACNTTADCPPAWVCDSRESTLLRSGDVRICVNPTCGDLK